MTEMDEAMHDTEAPATGRPYHHIVCDQFNEINVTLTKTGMQQLAAFSVIGMRSTDPISAGLAAVDRSPFKTVFVADLTTGAILFALSKNENYVKAARKKNPKPPTNPPPPPISACCQVCFAMGGTSCQALSDGSCICFGADRDTEGTIDTSEPLDRLS